MKVLSILLLTTILLAQDCRKRSSQKIDSNNVEEVMPVIQMVKNPCFGRCPIYSLTIYNDGKVVYVGQRFTQKMGTYTKQISTEEVAAYLKLFDLMDFWNMDEVYPTQLPDLAKTNMTLFKKDTSKTVTGDNFRPEALLVADKELVTLADSEEGWTLTKAHPDAGKLADDLIKNEIITKFKPDIDIPDFIESQAHLGLTIKKRVAHNLDLWLLTFDTDKINPDLMLKQLKEAPEILEAEFNKQLSPREH